MCVIWSRSDLRYSWPLWSWNRHLARSWMRFVTKPVPKRVMEGVEPLQYLLGEASAMFYRYEVIRCNVWVSERERGKECVWEWERESKHHIETLHIITVLLLILLNVFFFTAYPGLVKLGAGHTILVSVIGNFGIIAATTDKQANKRHVNLWHTIIM